MIIRNETSSDIEAMRLGFRNFPELVCEGVPQEVFFALPFTEKVPKGIVVFHKGFLAKD
jgi:putative acetyltransferase